MNWNDGGIPSGARKVQIYSPNGVDASGNTLWTTLKGIYILESWSPTRPQYVQKRYDETRKPNGALGQDDFVEASALVQLAYAATPLVSNGDAFTTARRGGGANESFVFINVDEPEEQAGVRKQPARLQQIVNSPSGNLPPSF